MNRSNINTGKMNKSNINTRINKSRLNAKKNRRKENKKNKIQAFIELSQLNNLDGKANGISKSQIKRKRNLKSDHSSELKKLRRDVGYQLNGQEKTSEVPPQFGELSVEQQRQVKRLLELRSKKRAERPTLILNEIGEAADLRTPPDKRVPLTIDDFQHFVIYSLFHSMSTKGVARWVQLMKKDKVKRRIFLIMEGAGLREYLENEPNLTTLKEFETRLEIATPLSYGANLIEELALVPMTKTQLNKLIEEYGSLQNAADVGELFNAFRTMFKISKSSEASSKTRSVSLPGSDKFSRKELLLTPWEMFEENYPLPVSGAYGQKFSDFVKTREEYSEVTERSPMWSIDCEMCLTVAGNELTRICILDEAHNIVFESYVKPKNKIRDYLTEYSGITPDLLRNVATTLEDVQKRICALCPPDVIFIGQSLNFDLKALKMIHPYIIDTSLIFNLSGMKHRKTKLRVLTEEFLSERIQIGREGHSPIEDALAAMKLVQMKLQHSVGWGNAVLSGPRSEEETEAARILLKAREDAGTDRLKGLKDYTDHILSSVKKQEELSKSLFSHLTRHNKNVLLVGKKTLLDDWCHYVKPTQSVEVCPVRTERMGVKMAKHNSPIDGVTILHVSLQSSSPQYAIAKMDRLVEKLLRNSMANTLYSILLTGRSGSPENGLLFLHLVREHVPFARLPDS